MKRNPSEINRFPPNRRSVRGVFAPNSRTRARYDRPCLAGFGEVTARFAPALKRPADRLPASVVTEFTSSQLSFLPLSWEKHPAYPKQKAQQSNAQTEASDDELFLDGEQWFMLHLLEFVNKLGFVRHFTLRQAAVLRHERTAKRSVTQSR